MNGKKRRHDNVDNDDDVMIDNENRENGSHEEEEEELLEHDNNNNDDDDDNDNNNKGKKSANSNNNKKKKNRPSKIMSESGQTDADRRLLRRRQRELHDDIAVGAGGEEGGRASTTSQGGGADELTRLRAQNNDLWRDVRYTREAVLDSENVDLIASKAARQAEKVVQVPRYDAVRVAQALLKKGTVRAGGSSQFNWRGLGFQVGVCFNALPSHASFLYGPLDAEYIPKERKERAQRRMAAHGDDDEEEEQPEDVDQEGKKKESDGNELSAVQKHIKVINTTLKEREKEARAAAIAESEEYVAQQLDQEQHDEAAIRKKKNKFVKENSHVHAVNCLFNPKSFTQTVENVFHFSFLVKDSLAGIKARSVEEAREYGGMPGPVIRPEKNRDGMDISAPTQAIVSLNMKDWRDMCKAYNVEESHVPHRVDGKVAKKEKKGRNSN